jgi:hypothetical protein
VISQFSAIEVLGYDSGLVYKKGGIETTFAIYFQADV